MSFNSFHNTNISLQHINYGRDNFATKVCLNIDKVFLLIFRFYWLVAFHQFFASCALLLAPGALDLHARSATLEIATPQLHTRSKRLVPWRCDL